MVGYGFNPLFARWIYAFGLSPEIGVVYRYGLPALLMLPFVTSIRNQPRESLMAFCGGLSMGIRSIGILQGSFGPSGFIVCVDLFYLSTLHHHLWKNSLRDPNSRSPYDFSTSHTLRLCLNSGTFKRHYRRALDCGGLVFPGSHRRNQHHPFVFTQTEEHESTIINGVHALREYHDWIAGFILAGWIFLDSRQSTGLLAFDRDRFDNRFNSPPAFHLGFSGCRSCKNSNLWICGISHISVFRLVYSSWTNSLERNLCRYSDSCCLADFGQTFKSNSWKGNATIRKSSKNKSKLFLFAKTN